MTIEVESNVPIPPKAPWGGIYPWKTMEVGESFLVPSKLSESSFRQIASEAGKKNGRKFSVRKLPDGSLRCWRVS